MLASAVHLPGLLAHLGPVISRYGYFAVGALIFLEDFGFPVPGETTLLCAAIYAGAGQLSPVLVGIIALVAAVLGDNVGFLIGRVAQRTLILRYGRYIFLTEERLARGERFFGDHGAQIIVVARFIEGLRQANGIIAGISGMQWRRFLLFNIIGATLWVACWLSVGVAAGSHIIAVYDAITRYSYIVFALFVVIVVTVALIKRKKRRQTH